nr:MULTISPECIES: hypothetical protein [Shewanella]
MMNLAPLSGVETNFTCPFNRCDTKLKTILIAKPLPPLPRLVVKKGAKSSFAPECPYRYRHLDKLAVNHFYGQ